MGCGRSTGWAPVMGGRDAGRARLWVPMAGVAHYFCDPDDLLLGLEHPGPL